MIPISFFQQFQRRSLAMDGEHWILRWWKFLEMDSQMRGLARRPHTPRLGGSLRSGLQKGKTNVSFFFLSELPNENT